MTIERHQVTDKVLSVRQRLDLLPDNGDRAIAITALADLVQYITKLESSLLQLQTDNDINRRTIRRGMGH